MVCGCCSTGDAKSVYAERANRYCTDILFLVLLIFATVASVALCVVSVQSNPSLLIDIVYPADGYGNNCGTGDLASQTKVVFPRLDSDFQEQVAVVSTGQWWKFRPTGVCAAHCPKGFDVNNPISYGGASYPCSENCGSGDGRGIPRLYYLYTTMDVVGRCIPTLRTNPAEYTDVPHTIACTPRVKLYDCHSAAAAELNSHFPGSVTCAVIESQPTARRSWQVCPADRNCSWGTDCCAAHEAVCPDERHTLGNAINGTMPLRIREDTQQMLAPSVSTDRDVGFTRQFATYVGVVLGAYEGLVVHEGRVAWITFGLIVPLVMAFVWALLLFFFAGVVVWILVWMLVLMMLTLDLVLSLKAGFFSLSDVDGALGRNITHVVDLDLSEAQGHERTWFMVIAVVSMILTVLVLLFIVLNRKCIRRFIAIIQEVVKVFKSMIIIILWPCFNLVGQALVLIFGFFALYFAANAPESLFPTAGWKVLVLVFQVLVVFWLSQFVQATIWTSMSAAIARWYVTDNAVFAERSCFGLGLGLGALLGGTCLIVCKHLGSMAFGALIIAIVQTIRAVVQVIDQNTQGLQKKNAALKFVMKGVQCCLYCLQKTIEAVTYYSFVYVGSMGVPFCKACQETIGFLFKYPAQTAVNKTVGKLLEILIGWSTPLLSSALAFQYLEYGAGDYALHHNTLWTAAITFVTSYLVTSCVTMVYNAAIDTIYICAFRDMELPDGPKFMSNDLREGFGLDHAADEAGEKAASYRSLNQQRKEEKENAYEAPQQESAMAESKEAAPSADTVMVL